MQNLVQKLLKLAAESSYLWCNPLYQLCKTAHAAFLSANMMERMRPLSAAPSDFVALVSMSATMLAHDASACATGATDGGSAACAARAVSALASSVRRSE